VKKDVVNFNAGPAGLPKPALERAQRELLDFEGTGMSIMEHSHREKSYEKVHAEAKSLVQELLKVPDTHDILFLQGGASQLFATVPMSFLPKGKSADYIHTGAWSKKAIEEAKIFGEVHIAGTGEVNGKPVRIPAQADLSLDPSATYVHITSNNTIEGTEYFTFPSTGAVPLVADMSSDMCARPIDVSKFGLIYAGAQKNLGPSGVVLVIIDKGFMARARTDIPTIFRFKTHAENDSLYNTPPTFSIYIMRNVLAWLKEIGGLDAMAKRNSDKAAELYGAIEKSEGWYRSPVERASRSWMNIVFRLPSEDLEKKFIAEAEKEGMVGLKGHRSVGGIRASTYNAVSLEGVKRLTSFMAGFKARNG
jgi:phosphoserine aminotransferase